MKFTTTEEWFQSRAHLEEGQEVGAGSLPHFAKTPVQTALDSVSFGKIISLLRRKQRWTIDRLASESEATSAELAALESGYDYLPTITTVRNLARVFGLSPQALTRKAGLDDFDSFCVREDPAHYHVNSGLGEPLSANEEQALEKILQELREDSEGKPGL
jgi:HTH-type transcriptional regulator, competence development regulator